MSARPPHEQTAGRQETAGRLSAVQDAGLTRTLLSAPDGVVRRTVLPGGLRVITEQMPGARSASVGVWVGVGSVHERPRQHGCSHFLEHLLFKGTRERSAMDISVELDTVGGEFNAFTAKEYTCFHARVLGEDLGVAVDVLGDMVTSSRVDAVDVEAERNVILDEIAMHDDDPDDVVHNLFAEQAWGDTPIGRPIAGTVASIQALTREQIVRFYRTHYSAPHVVVSAAGAVDHDELCGLVAKSFDRRGFLSTDATPEVAVHTARARRVRPGVRRVDRALQEVNLVLGVGGLTRSDDRRFALGVLNTALGGGTSSRLFQEVREARGLAYSVFSFAAHHNAAGVVGVSVGCLPGKVDAVLDTVRGQLREVAETGISVEELVRGQGQLRGGLVLGLEDTSSRMSRVGKADLVYDELLGLDDVIARIDAVTLDDVRSLAADLFAQPEVLALVGPAPR